MANPVVRLLWIVAGFVSVGLGSVGVVVPGMPTTVFMVAAAWCFSKSSPRLEAWLLNLPGVGSLVRDYRAGLGMPLRAKQIAVTSIVVACLLSVALGVDAWWLRGVIAVSGAFGIWWILAKVPTRPDEVPDASAVPGPGAPRDERTALPVAARVFRVAAFVEALTWAGLLVGMFLKYLTDVGERGVEIFGPIHGVVVFCYVAAVLWAGTTLRWSTRTFVFGLLASVPPFATVQFERWLTATGQLERQT